MLTPDPYLSLGAAPEWITRTCTVALQHLTVKAPLFSRQPPGRQAKAPAGAQWPSAGREQPPRIQQHACSCSSTPWAPAPFRAATQEPRPTARVLRAQATVPSECQPRRLWIQGPCRLTHACRHLHRKQTLHTSGASTATREHAQAAGLRTQTSMGPLHCNQPPHFVQPFTATLHGNPPAHKPAQARGPCTSGQAPAANEVDAAAAVPGRFVPLHPAPQEPPKRDSLVPGGRLAWVALGGV